MDQTPVWLDIASTTKTLDRVGSKKVSALIPRGNPREKFTVIQACSETGDKLPPAVIMNSAKQKFRIALVNGVLVFKNPGTLIANSNIMSKWIEIMPKGGCLTIPGYRDRSTCGRQ